MTNRGFALSCLPRKANSDSIFIVAAVFLLVIGLFSSSVFAQTESTAVQLYGRGTHAFNAKQYADAVNMFAQAEAAGTQDPRVFFYRGLSHFRLGDEAAAAADFATGSRMELTVSGRSYSVPKALERIQGRERILIEQHRRAAKRTWDAEQNKRRQEDFQSQKAQNQQLYNAIIESGEAAAATVTQPVEQSLAVPFGAQPVMPFGDTGMKIEQTKLVGVSDSGISKDNIFIEDINRPAVIEEPVKVDTTPKKPKDGFDDYDFSGADDEVSSFDDAGLLQGSGSGQTSGFGNLFGGADDPFGEGQPSSGGIDDPFGEGQPSSGSIGNAPFGGQIDGGMGGVGSGGISMPQESGSAALAAIGSGDAAKGTGRSFGGALAGLFKKSDKNSSAADPVPASNTLEPTTPEPVSTPVTPDPAPADDSDSSDPFGDSFDDSFSNSDSSDSDDSDPFGDDF